MAVSKKNKIILRDLAKKVSEIANNPKQNLRKKLWEKVNRLEPCRPPIYYHMETLCWPEIISNDDLLTDDVFSRRFEMEFRKTIWKWENLNDDAVTEPVVQYHLFVDYPGRIEPEKIKSSEMRGAYNCTPVINMENDLEKICTHEVIVDWDSTKQEKDLVTEIFSDILEPVPNQPDLCGYIFDDLCQLMGMESVFINMAENPMIIHDAMERLSKQWEHRVLQLEKMNILLLNNGGTVCYNGGFGVTDRLPAKDFGGKHVRLKDLWGFSAAQASISISPDMYSEFVLPYEKRVLSLFGLNCYACCERVDKRMHLIRTIPNLRRISVSEWNDIGKAAEEIKKDYIFSYKPTASYVTDFRYEPDAERKYLKEVFEKAGGCIMEIVNNAIETCHNQPQRIIESSNITMNLSEDYWRYI